MKKKLGFNADNVAVPEIQVKDNENEEVVEELKDAESVDEAEEDDDEPSGIAFDNLAMPEIHFGGKKKK